jgi:alkylation response protein AidB-like acyl-CoA dehydrogenase
MLSGRLRAVAFARAAKHLAVLVHREGGGEAIALMEAGAVRIADGTSIAGDALNAVHFDGVRPVAVKDAPAGLDGAALLLMGAAARAMQMTGALEAILDLSVAYANERVAFERPIAKFQAVQHNLARLAGEVAASIAAAGPAADAIASAGGFDEGVFLEAASAKIRVGEAAGEGRPSPTRCWGAIGFTREHAAPLDAAAVGLARRLRQRASGRSSSGNLVAAKGADADCGPCWRLARGGVRPSGSDTVEQRLEQWCQTRPAEGGHKRGSDTAGNAQCRQSSPSTPSASRPSALRCARRCRRSSPRRWRPAPSARTAAASTAPSARSSAAR